MNGNYNGHHSIALGISIFNNTDSNSIFTFLLVIVCCCVIVFIKVFYQNCWHDLKMIAIKNKKIFSPKSSILIPHSLSKFL